MWTCDNLLEVDIVIRTAETIVTATSVAAGPVQLQRRRAPTRCCAYPARDAGEHSIWYPSRKAT